MYKLASDGHVKFQIKKKWCAQLYMYAKFQLSTWSGFRDIESINFGRKKKYHIENGISVKDNKLWYYVSEFNCVN